MACIYGSLRENCLSCADYVCDKWHVLVTVEARAVRQVVSFWQNWVRLIPKFREKKSTKIDDDTMVDSDVELQTRYLYFRFYLCIRICLLFSLILHPFTHSVTSFPTCIYKQTYRVVPCVSLRNRLKFITQNFWCLFAMHHARRRRIHIPVCVLFVAYACVHMKCLFY